MKKILILFITFLLGINLVSANVDTTDISLFNYGCKDGKVKMDATFDLGGHHKYNRTYLIDRPGFIEIKDKHHTTITKGGIALGTTIKNVDNVSNCPLDCSKTNANDNITYTGNWIYTETENNVITINVASDFFIEGSSNSFTITNNSSDNSGIRYKLDGKEIVLDEINSVSIELREDGFYLNKVKVDDIKKADGFDNFFDEYSLEKVQNKLILKKKVYKREKIGIPNKEKDLSGDRIDIKETYSYPAVSGSNTGNDNDNDLMDDVNGISGNYSTGLNYWDYNQHHYTTTIITLYTSDTLMCKITEDNINGNINSVYTFSGNAGGITNPEFEGPQEINGSSLGDDGVFIIEATGSLNISGFKQTQLAYFGEDLQYINEIEISIKKEDFTFGNLTYPLQDKITNTGTIINIQDIVLSAIDEQKTHWGSDWGEYKDVITKIAGSYQIIFTPISDGQRWQTISKTLIIIPNNQFQLGTLKKETSGDKIANGSGTITMCQDFTDSFGNPIKRSSDIISSKVQVTAQDAATLISNVIIPALESKLCFDIARLAPGLPGVIDIYIPQHNIDINLTIPESGGNKVHFALDFGKTDNEGNTTSYDSTGNGTCNGDTCDMTECRSIPPALETSIDRACKVSGFFDVDSDGDGEGDGNNPNSTTFKSAFTLSLKIKEGSEWSGRPVAGLEQTYRTGLSYNGDTSMIQSQITLKSINTGTIQASSSGVGVENGHYFETFSGTSQPEFSKSGLDFTSTNNQFKAKINVKDDNAVLLSPIVEAGNIFISYKIKEVLVNYKLPRVTLNGCERDTLGVKVIGNLQADGKASITGQEENFSDLSTSEMRGIIKKNATELTRGMKSLDVVNGVKYVTGNITINGSQSYETLIVKNGNVFISSNVSSNSGKPLGIIVLKDNYDVKNDYNQAGNVYVANNVENINAVIYADGAFMSSSSSESYPPYNAEDLTKPLVIQGSLFTRNTIGGSISGTSGKIFLPGGQITSDSTLAGYYDLNNIRVWGSDCSETAQFPLTIKYDSKLQTNPPKGFSK